MRFVRLLSFVLVLLLLASSVGSAFAHIQTKKPAAYDFRRARQLLAEMTPEERVGQLFLVSFSGSTAGPDSQIYDLIVNHHVGGVVLLAANDNFVDSPNTLSAAAALTTQLQTIEWNASQAASNDPAASAAAYVPLFIGITQPAGGSPNAQILSGMAPLPSQMALGAAWDVSLAERVGEAAGDELAGLGFNMLFGPSLDVLEDPDAALMNGLGADAFGGDPFWVSQMAQAYLRGLHNGSKDRLLVIARNFPGRGSTDRPPGEEAPTVRKSLEQLKQIELAPFFAVTDGIPGDVDVTDGLLVSHIRYQGFQGNIRATTRPVSFDSQALSLILALPEFADWRASGGLLVSDDLGSQTVRRFYDPGGTNFQARIAARDAFLAGNDLIYLGNVKSAEAADNYSTVISVLAYFVQKYREDAAFAERVDESAARILAAKYRLFDEFLLENVLPSANRHELVGEYNAVAFEAARRSATLVSPDPADLDSVLPEPPGLYDNIVFITDTRAISQCSACTSASIIGVNDMQNAVLRLYGPHAGELVSASRLSSYSLEEVSAILSDGGGNAQLQTALSRANWIIINILDASPSQPQASLLRRFLSERQDLLRNKYVILFAFGAPYYLDATEISNLTAYYCLYSSTAPFVDVAARLLFRELTPAGDLPVSVPGVGYDLFTALTPDPNQVILLSLDLSPAPVSTGSATPPASPPPAFRVGDTITVRTGILLDHNGHPVPDGTGVQFFLVQSGAGGVLQQVDAATSGGVASAAFNIDRSGLLEIRAVSEPARTSVILQMDVSGDAFSVTVVAPSPSAEPAPTLEDEILPEAGETRTTTGVLPGFSGWLLAVAILGLLGGGTYYAVSRFVSLRWGLRMGLCVLLGGLTGYTYLALRLPGVEQFLQQARYGGIVVVTVVCALLGSAAGYLWWRLNAGRRQF